MNLIRFYYGSASQAQLFYWACLVIDPVKQKRIDRLIQTLLTKWALKELLLAATLHSSVGSFNFGPLIIIPRPLHESNFYIYIYIHACNK